MLVATFHKDSKTMIYWIKNNETKRVYCESQVVAKLLLAEERLKNKINQTLFIER